MKRIALTEQPDTPRAFTVAEAERLERQLVPLLNTLRIVQGKPPLVLVGKERVKPVK